MAQVLSLAATPYAKPAVGECLRVAFVGHPTLASFSPPTGAGPRLQTLFAQFRAGDDADRLRARIVEFEPHVVFVFDPEDLDCGALDGLPVATVGFLCGGLPQVGSGSSQETLRGQLASGRRSAFDRIISCDPLATEASSTAVVWRSLPLPVSDRFYHDVRAIARRPRSMFIGRSTAHRERTLLPAKHHHDLLHAVFGLQPEELAELFEDHEVGVNLHPQPGSGFSTRALMHLAAGHLLLSEPLRPAHGLEVNIDYLELAGPGMLVETLERLERFPDMYHRIRVRGRMKAEQFRASRVFARLAEDVFDDIAAFGTERV